MRVPDWPRANRNNPGTASRLGLPRHNETMFTLQFRLLTRLAAVLLLPILVACAGPAPTKGSGDVLQLAGPQPGQAVLLGEIHDHVTGHERRLQILQGWIDQGSRPALVVEQFDRDRQTQLDAAMADCANADCVIERAGAGQWHWPFYRPLIALALKYKLPIRAGNIARSETSRIVREGLAAAFEPAIVTRFALAGPLPAEVASAQQREIIDGHCRMLPDRVVPGMVNAQVARDVWMALQILEFRARPVILIAGNGHVRRDIGVPFWLRQQQMLQSTAVGFVESLPGTGAGVYDQVIELPIQPRPDPCQSFRR